jgi:hypothetical protein
MKSLLLNFHHFLTSPAEEMPICNFSRHISAKFCAEIDKNHYICSVELKKHDDDGTKHFQAL